ncbi:MAG: hypothetical protein Q3972_01355 [Corynebacterium sp.]|nr:hypothetical protein [Corynebacterium sp.]
MKLKKIIGATALSAALVTGVVAPAGAEESTGSGLTISRVNSALSSEDMSVAERASVLGAFSGLGLVWMAATTVLLTNGYNTLVDMGYLPRTVIPPFLR